jgi:hypothetical protein
VKSVSDVIENTVAEVVDSIPAEVKLGFVSIDDG